MKGAGLYQLGTKSLLGSAFVDDWSRLVPAGYLVPVGQCFCG